MVAEGWAGVAFCQCDCANNALVSWAPRLPLRGAGSICSAMSLMADWCGRHKKQGIGKKVAVNTEIPPAGGPTGLWLAFFTLRWKMAFGMGWWWHYCYRRGRVYRPHGATGAGLSCSIGLWPHLAAECRGGSNLNGEQRLFQTAPQGSNASIC